MRKTNKTSKNRKGGDGWFPSTSWVPSTSWFSSTSSPSSPSPPCLKRTWYGSCIDKVVDTTTPVTSDIATAPPIAPPPTDPIAPPTVDPSLRGGKRTKKNNRRKRTSGKRSVFGSVMKMFTCNKHSRRNKNKKGGIGYKPLYLQPFADSDGNQLPPYHAYSNLVGGNIEPYSSVGLTMDQQAVFNPKGNSYMIAGKHKMKKMSRIKK